MFLELTRVKQYFDKIKAAEAPAKERNLALDKSAAARFIKAGLVSISHQGTFIPICLLCQSGNEKYDLEKAEREAKERARAHIKFQDIAKKATQAEPAKEPVLLIDSSESESSSESSAEAEAEAEELALAPVAVSKKKKGKKNKSSATSSSAESAKPSKSSTDPKAEAKAARKAKREKKKAKLAKKQKKNQS